MDPQNRANQGGHGHGHGSEDENGNGEGSKGHGHGSEDEKGNGEGSGDIENAELFGGKEIGRFWSDVSDKNASFSYSQPLLIKRTNTTSQVAIVGANICPIESLDYE